MFHRSAPSPAGLLLFILLQSAPTLSKATAMEDSVQATISGAVSAHQRSQALLALAHQNMDKDPVVAHGHALGAVRFAEQTGDVKVEHRALMGLAEAEERIGLFGEFMKTTLKAVQLAQTIGDPKLIAQDLHELSEAYLLNAMPEKAVDEARNALAMLLPTHDAAAIAEAQRTLISTLLHTSEHNELWDLADRCLTRAHEQHDELEAARLSQLIGASLIAQGKFNDAHTYLSAAAPVLSISGSNTERFAVQCDLAQVSLGLGRTEVADRTLNEAGALLRSADSWAHRYRYTELKYRLAMALGRWQEALSLLQQMKDRSDSANTARLDIQMAQMQTLYQLDRKEQANAALRTENAKVAEKIAGTQMSNRLLIGIVVVMSILLTAVFFTSRQSLRLARRMGLKNAVIKKQHDEIHAKNLELQRQNMRLAETLVSEEEKEKMIKEIHHRVKNNLQVVDSLLQIQGADLEDPKVDRVLKEAQGRIRSMAMVHEHIYRTAGGAPGGLQQHLEQLVRNILVAHGAHDRISVMVNAPFASFQTDTLMPLTLVVNELFTNAVKYAFHGKHSGRVTIVVRHAGAAFELLFSDDGIGLELAEQQARDRSFGMQLVNMLANQLNGEVRFLKGQGTTISMTFAPENTVLRVAS